MKSLLPILSLLLLASCGKHEQQQIASSAVPSVTVKVQTAKLETAAAFEEVVGTVRSKQRAIVEAKVSGRVLEYVATPGTMVKAGDLLARLDAQEIQARVDQAKAMLDQASRDFERQKQLITSGATTRQEYDAAEARVKVAAASLAEAETMLGHAKVTAPFDGVITRKLAEVGDLAMPGKPLAEVESPAALRFEADLPEAILERVKLGANMKVNISSLANPLEAAASEIAPVADAASRTFLVKFDLPAAEGLRAGQFGRVSVPVAEAKVLRIPQAAVLKRGQMEIVFIVEDGRALLRLVKTGKTIEGAVEVLSGLEEGQQVVTSDAARLIDGQPVTIQP